MKLGPKLIYRCFACRGLLASQGFYSRNNFRSKFWTDGQSCNPDSASSGDWLKCAHCGAISSIDEAKEIDEYEFYLVTLPLEMNPPDLVADIKKARRQKKRYDGQPDFDVPTAHDLLAHLKRGNFSPEIELSIRLMAWWRGNDQKRNLSEDKPLEPEQIQNLECVLSLMEQTNFPEPLCKAEVFRQLGRMKEARDTIENRPEPEKTTWLAGHLLKLIQAGDTHLRHLRRDWEV